VDHGLTGVELGEGWSGSIPPASAAQARRAARAGVSLDTVLRRYVVGSTLLGDCLMREAEHGGLAAGGAVLRDVLGVQAAMLDRLLAAVTAEYTSELERAARSPGRRRGELVERLLAGDPADSEDPADPGVELGYEFDAWHLAAIAVGAAAEEILRRLAAALDRRLLCVARGEQTVWGWLGGQRELPPGEVERLLLGERTAEVSLALGEPGSGVEGWRLSHRQAREARRIALLRPRRLTRYADVALVASMLQDPPLAHSLVETFLSPLGGDRNGGAALRETLRAYFAAERNASSAAGALGVTRHTVENRLRAIEQKLGRTLRTHHAELEIALRLEELAEPCPPPPPPHTPAPAGRPDSLPLRSPR
jgi:hypothetical protein